MTADEDLIAATATYATTPDPPFDPEQVPVDPSFWVNPRAAEEMARVSSDYALSPRMAAMPAAWRLWLADTSDLEYADLRRQAEVGIGTPGWLEGAVKKVGKLPASFFWYLLQAPALRSPRPEEAMLKLARGQTADAVRVGLLSVLSGKVELSIGQAELLWLGSDRLLCRSDGLEFDLPRSDAHLYRVLEEPILLGRSQLLASDACPLSTRSQAQIDLLRSADLAQSVFPPVSQRDQLRSWLASPPAFAWVGPRDSATYYRVATEVFGLSCVPATTCFVNPSTHESCCIQASVASARPVATDLLPELQAVDFVLGVARRSPAVVDAAGRPWWGGPVSLFGQGKAPTGRLEKKIDASKLRMELIACGCLPRQVADAVARLESISR